MDDRFIWHPGSSPINQRWPLVPALRGDELLSSWLIRCSLCHTCDPLEIAQKLWPMRRIWTRDCDLMVPTLPLAELVSQTGIPQEALRNSTLEPVCRLLNVPLPRSSITPWVLSQGGRNTSRAGGLQYCPICFAEPKPFYRIQWRVAWYTSCPTHKVLLRDHCPRCRTIVSPHRLHFAARDLSRCHVCQSRLADVDPIPAEHGSQELEAFADSIVQGNEAGFGGLVMPAEEWFLLMRGLHHLMRAMAKKRTGSVRTFLSQLDVDVDSLPLVSLGIQLECLPIPDRVAYLSALNAILNAGATRFSVAAHETPLCHSYCKAAIGRDLSCMSQLLPNTTPRRHTDVPRDPSLPRTKQDVLRRWLQFLRKANRAGVIR